MCDFFVPLGLIFLCGRLRASKESSISSKVGEETEEELDRSSICSEFIMHNKNHQKCIREKKKNRKAMNIQILVSELDS